MRIPWSGSHHPPEKPEAPADHRPRQRRRTHPERNIRVGHATSTMGGVVGLEKPGTHSDIHICAAHRCHTNTRKEKEKYCQTGRQQSGFKWPICVAIWSAELWAPQMWLPSLQEAVTGQTVLHCWLLPVWDGRETVTVLIKRSLIHPQPECVVTGEGGRSSFLTVTPPPPPPQTGLPVLLGSPPQAQTDH